MIDLEAFRGLNQEQKLDASGAETSFLITGPSGTPIRLSASAYHLLRAVRAGIGWEALAQRLSEHRGQEVSATTLETSYRRTIDRITTLDARGQGRVSPQGFWFRRQLLAGDTVARIARRLTLLYAPGPALGLIALIALTFAHALTSDLEALFSGRIFWPAYALFALSLIAHELGHATACLRYGARPADIGFTVYWTFPALYSDVTAAWQLDRRQRVVVDLGGIFFQLIFGAGYWLLYLATGWRALEAALWMILCGCLFSLNPFFKLDGYWVLADALGVTHLGRQPKRLWRHLADRLRGKPIAPLPWPNWVVVALAIYTPLVVLFWVCFVGRLVPMLLQRAITYPALLTQITRRLLEAGSFAPGDLKHLLISTFFLLVSGLMIRQLAIRSKATLTGR